MKITEATDSVINSGATTLPDPPVALLLFFPFRFAIFVQPRTWTSKYVERLNETLASLG